MEVGKIKKVIPEGTRDYTIEECFKRNKIIEKIKNIFSLWGYREVSTPTIEYFDNFNSKTKTLKEEEMYKFFDNRGHILVLRPDMTVPVARMVATKLKDLETPMKLSYCSSIFRVHESFLGGRNEYLDCGVELIGVKDRLGDLEIITTAIETLKNVTNKSFKLDIGYVNILKTAMNEMGITENQQEYIADLIEKKSLISLSEYVKSLNINESEKELLIDFPNLFGEEDVIIKAKSLTKNKNILASITYLENIYLGLKQLGYEQYISIDMAMVPRLDYYTGIIFRGYIEGVGRNVLRGGRYDGLIKSFGRDMPAVGFSIGVELLLDNITEENQGEIKEIILEQDNEIEAVRKAILSTQKGKEIKFKYKD